MSLLLVNMLIYDVNSPRESVRVCFYRRWFVCLSVCLCLSVTTITKKILDGFVPN